MKQFPFISLQQSLVVLRVATACMFIAHAVVRISGGTIIRFGGFLNGKGLIYGNAIVWAITVFEIAGGLTLAIGYFTKLFCAGFVILLIIGIVLIHAANGWFVGEHGTGGCEYSVILIIALIVIAANEGKKKTITA